MADTPKLSAAQLMKKQQKEYGGTIGNFGGKLHQCTRLPTGWFPFDLATGGGIPQGRTTLIFGPESSGKCHAAGTRVLMLDGAFKNVEDVRIGNRLMGIDSTPRTVTGIGRGHGELYRITPVKGNDSFVVNAEHVLSLVCTHDQGHRRRGDIVNINLKDYLTKSDDWRIYHHLYRVPVEFETKEQFLDPYFLGLWLGDGASRVPAITTADPEIVDYLESYAADNGWRVSKYGVEGACPSYAVVGNKRGRPESRPVVPRDWLERLNLLRNKHIPDVYKTGDRQQRLRLLAGLLDSDGYRGSGSSMGFVNTNQRLCEDVLFLARSLGLYASMRPQKTTCQGKKFDSFALYLSGDFHEVPLLLERKRPESWKRAGSALTSRFTVEPIGEGDYFGFELDGDHLYLLDSFIVSHNTNICLRAIRAFQALNQGKYTAFFDLENSWDPDWARAMGVDTDYVAVINPDYAEQCVDMVVEWIGAEDCGLVILDSLANMIGAREAEKTATVMPVGVAAFVVGQLVRKTTLALQQVRKQGRYPTLIYVNQIRSKVGVMFGNPETMTGGHAPRFQAAFIIRTFGKNITDSKISKVMPVAKETTFVIQKWKVPIIATHGVFTMITQPYKGLGVGDCDDFNTVTSYAKDLGLLAKGDKGGWVLDGAPFPTLEAIKDMWLASPKTALDFRAHLLSLVDPEVVSPPPPEDEAGDGAAEADDA